MSCTDPVLGTSFGYVSRVKVVMLREFYVCIRYNYVTSNVTSQTAFWALSTTDNLPAWKISISPSLN